MLQRNTDRYPTRVVATAPNAHAGTYVQPRRTTPWARAGSTQTFSWHQIYSVTLFLLLASIDNTVFAMLRRVALDSTARTGTTRTNASNDVPAPIVRGPLHIDPTNYTATLNNVPLVLTRKEFELLALLAEHPGRAFSRDFLLERVWGYQYDGADRTVDTHIAQLRKKLGAYGEKIVTVWGVGYRLVA